MHSPWPYEYKRYESDAALFHELVSACLRQVIKLREAHKEHPDTLAEIIKKQEPRQNDTRKNAAIAAESFEICERTPGDLERFKTLVSEDQYSFNAELRSYEQDFSVPNFEKKQDLPSRPSRCALTATRARNVFSTFRHRHSDSSSSSTTSD